jgi:histone-binding protein RBBP4
LKIPTALISKIILSEISAGMLVGGDNTDLRLRGNDMEEYGLSWSPLKEGYLLISGSHDHKIYICSH